MPGNGGLFQLDCGASDQHGIEVARLGRNVQQDGVFDQAGFLHLDRIHHHIRQFDVLASKLDGRVEALYCCRNSPHHRDTWYAFKSVDQPLHDGASFTGDGIAHASVRFVQHQIQSQCGVFNRVLNRVPKCVSLRIRATLRHQIIFALKAAYQQAFLAQLLGVEKVDFSGIELAPHEGVFHHHQIRSASDAVAGFFQSPACLLVQRWVITEPDHHCTGVRIEVKFVVAVKQGFEYRCRHHGFARAGHRSQGKGRLVAFGMPQAPCLLQVGKRIAHGIILVILEDEFHALSPFTKLKLSKYDSYKRTGSTPLGNCWAMA